jgi:hypothetical protein
MPGPTLTLTSSPSLTQWLPTAELGQGVFIYVWSGGVNQFTANSAWSRTGVNYFGLSAVTSIPRGNEPSGQAGLTVQQAYGIDKKVDDGLPQSGSVTAQYVDVTTFGNSSGYGWAGSGGQTGAAYTTATPGSSTTCFDNGNTAGATQQYSVEISNGANVTCALSFRMQAGD